MTIVTLIVSGVEFTPSVRVNVRVNVIAAIVKPGLIVTMYKTLSNVTYGYKVRSDIVIEVTPPVVAGSG